MKAARDTPGASDVTKADSRLLPCPFCRSTDVYNWQSHDAAPNTWCVFCAACNTEGPHCNEEEKSIELWNSRDTAKLEQANKELLEVQPLIVIKETV